MAILAVLIGHLINIPLLQQIVGWGDLGVNLFFCLSGFLITNILLELDVRPGRRFAPLRAFYARRFLRIFPIYYLTLAVAVFAGYGPVIENLPRLLTYTVNLPGMAPTGDLGAASHLWSLSIEEQFYVLWPLLVMFVPRAALPGLLAMLIAASLAFKYYLATIGAPYYDVFATIASRGDTLAAGALAAVVLAQKPTVDRPPLVPGWLAGAMLVFYIALIAIRIAAGIDPLYTGQLAFGVTRFFVSSVSFAVLIVFIVERREHPLSRLLGVRLLRDIGRISYGLYVYHAFVWHVIDQWPVQAPWPFLAMFEKTFLTLALTFAIATLSWVLIEAPILRLKRYFPYDRRAAATDAVTSRTSRETASATVSL